MLSFVKFKKQKTGDLLLVVDLNFNYIVDFLVSTFKFLDSLAFNHGLLVILSALGIGFGIGITVFRSPPISFATPIIEHPSRTKAEITQIKFEDLDKVVKVRTGDEPSWSLTTKQAIQIPNLSSLTSDTITIFGEYQPAIFGDLDKLSLGSKLTVLKSNNGLYHYQVIEIRQVDRDQLLELQMQTTTSLLLYTYRPLNRDNLIVVIARGQ